MVPSRPSTVDTRTPGVCHVLAAPGSCPGVYAPDGVPGVYALAGVIASPSYSIYLQMARNGYRPNGDKSQVTLTTTHAFSLATASPYSILECSVVTHPPYESAGVVIAAGVLPW